MTQSEMALQALWTDSDPAECQAFRALSTKCSQTREQGENELMRVLKFITSLSLEMKRRLVLFPRLKSEEASWANSTVNTTVCAVKVTVHPKIVRRFGQNFLLNALNVNIDTSMQCLIITFTVQVYHLTLMLVGGGDAEFVGDQNGVLSTGRRDIPKQTF